MGRRRVQAGISLVWLRTLLPPREYRHEVALAWDSKVGTLSIFGIEIALSSILSVDLDLQIFDSQGVQVGYSGSWDNSYEIAEFKTLARPWRGILRQKARGPPRGLSDCESVVVQARPCRLILTISCPPDALGNGYRRNHQEGIHK